MSYANPDALVSTDWLAQHLDAPDVRVVDGSYFMPYTGRDARAQYDERHIPDAVFFDINEIADTDNPLPHMMPRQEKFASRVRQLGLGDGNRIIVYDGPGLFSAARVWWMFRVFGHNDIAILDGGLPKWLAESRPVTDDETMPRERHFTSRLNSLLLRDLSQMMANLKSKRDQVIDARSPGRFEGSEAEPRPGLRTGHIPASRNLHYQRMLDPETGTMADAEALRGLFAEAGLDLSRPVTASCGSGVTAAILALGLYLIGYPDAAVYDGSWTEWGSRNDTPLEP
jgi:thiosulfate/3-mercaptopyruvate sulfurtransferase